MDVIYIYDGKAECSLIQSLVSQGPSDLFRYAVLVLNKHCLII